MSLPLPASSPPQYVDEKQPLVPDAESAPSDMEGCQNHACPHRRGHGPGGHKHKRRRRFIKAFVLFIVLLGLGRLAGKAITHHIRRHRHHHQHYGPGHMLANGEYELPHMTFGESMETNVHPDITLEHCANWSSPSSTHTISPSPLNLFKPSTARAEFTLPLTSPSLQVLSHGPSVGNFRIVQDADGHSAGGVRVEVLAKYRGKQAVEHVKVCSFTRQGNEGLVEGEGHGVIILGRRPSRSLIGFEIIVHLPPASSLENKLYINKFETNLPHFAHVIGSIGSAVEFGEVVFRSGVMPFVAESLSAAKIVIQTHNSIEGNFAASEKLELLTMNGRIKANVVLENDPEKGVTDLVMRTSHAPIDANVTLTSTTPISGQYSISALTYHSPLTLTFPPSTPSSMLPTLLLTAHTSFAPLTVALPATFTGNFSASTNTRIPALKPHIVLVNEEGDGRKVEFQPEGKGVVEGTVWFAGEGEGRGEVSVGTVLAPAWLRI